jgi:hypothetical protein
MQEVNQQLLSDAKISQKNISNLENNLNFCSSGSNPVTELEVLKSKVDLTMAKMKEFEAQIRPNALLNYGNMEGDSVSESVSPRAKNSPKRRSPERAFSGCVSSRQGNTISEVNEKLQKQSNQIRDLHSYIMEMKRNDCIQRMVKLERKQQNLEHDLQLAAKSRIQSFNELMESMKDYRHTKNDFRQRIELLEAYVQKLNNKLNSSVKQISDHVNRITEDFLSDYQDLKEENIGISREFKRSLKEYRSFITEQSKSQTRIKMSRSTERNTKVNLLTFRDSSKHK